jgi:tetrapyrrole methylase family protein/MazG family protein
MPLGQGTNLGEYGDPDEVKKELGDILLHIVFYSKIGDEQQHFDIGDVIDSLCAKLIRRHPHIYGEVKADDAETVKQNWEKIKLAEKGRNEKRSVLDGVPRSLASLVKAYRMQEKVAQVGFDWKSVDGAIDKVQEEWQELRDAATSKEKEEEFGDLLFALVNYARFSGINPDDALENTNRKFIRRFRYIEDRAAETDRKMGDFSLEELDAWWNEAKANGL